ncbi:hypothetical protein ACFX12_005584 [Malus domestica]
MEPKACELPKGFVLGRDENIHLRIIPLGDVGCYNPPPLGARRPRRHTSDQRLALIPFVTSRPGTDHFPGLFQHRSTILSALGPNHALTVLFLGTHEQLPSGGSPIMRLLSRATHLTFEFQWNPKPMSSQKTSC